MRLHKGFVLHPEVTIQDVWCPTTSTGTWVAQHPVTGEDFLTGNSTHSSPNLAQIPSSKDFRSLFTAPEGWEFVGADLANIELRVLAHYLAPFDGGKYSQAVQSKDMHWYHSGLAGFIDQSKPENATYDEHNIVHKQARNQAKVFVFGWLTT